MDNAQEYFPPLHEIYNCIRKNNNSKKDHIILKMILDINEPTKTYDEEFVSTSKKFYKLIGQDTLEQIHQILKRNKISILKRVQIVEND